MTTPSETGGLRQRRTSVVDAGLDKSASGSDVMGTAFTKASAGDSTEREASTASTTRSSSTATPGLSRAPSWNVSSSGTPFFGSSREDIFGGGLYLFDLLVSLDAHLDLLGRRMKPLTEEWKAKARKELETRGKALRDVKDKLGINKPDRQSSGWEVGTRPPPRKPKRHSTDTGLGDDDDESLARSDPEKKERRRKRLDMFEQGRDQAEREFREFREKMKLRVKVLQDRWNDSKTVTLREKVSFFAAVNNVLCTTLLFALWPQYIPLAYSVQAIYYLPLRIYTYKKLAWHYFLLDLCYYVNFLTLIYLHVFPSSTVLLEACYGLSMGPLATAIATWRNSFVPHSFDKVVSLFIHIYPPLVFTVLRHFYPDVGTRYPAVAALPSLSFKRHFFICSVVYLIWQGLYYQFVIVYRAKKIAEGGRVTSFTYLLNSKKGIISNILHKIPPEKRAGSFIAAQYVYTLVTICPGYFLLYESRVWSGLYVWAFFAVSVWNGASFYIQVFGRRFEKEFNKLKKELEDLNREVAESRAAEAAARGGLSSTPTTMSGAATPNPASEAGSQSGAVTPTSSFGMSRQSSQVGRPRSDAGHDGASASMSRSVSASSSGSLAPEEAPAAFAAALKKPPTSGSAEGEDGSGGSSSGSVKSGSDSWINVDDHKKKAEVVDREATPKP